jgi:hypothetical protein
MIPCAHGRCSKYIKVDNTMNQDRGVLCEFHKQGLRLSIEWMYSDWSKSRVAKGGTPQDKPGDEEASKQH